MILTLLLILALAGGLVPLLQRDLRRAYGRRVARRFWAEVHERVVAYMAEREELHPDAAFQREHLTWWAES